MLTVKVTGLLLDVAPILNRALCRVVTSTDFLSDTLAIPAGFLFSLERMFGRQITEPRYEKTMFWFQTWSDTNQAVQL